MAWHEDARMNEINIPNQEYISKGFTMLRYVGFSWVLLSMKNNSTKYKVFDKSPKEYPMPIICSTAMSILPLTNCK